jgi:hypothetical protein
VKVWGVVIPIANTGPKSNATAHIVKPMIFRVITGSFAWRLAPQGCAHSKEAGKNRAFWDRTA